MKKILFSLLILFGFSLQAQEFCNTAHSTDQQLIDWTRYESFLPKQKSAPGQTWIVPVVIYIWNNPQITADDIQDQLQVLNDEFSDLYSHMGFDVRFCLATTENRNPLPTPSNYTIQWVYQYPDRGLFWIEDEEFRNGAPNYPVLDPYAPGTPSITYFDNATGNLDHDRYLKIFIGPCDASESFSTIIPPYLATSTHKMIGLDIGHTIHNTISPGLDDGKVLVHEVGHYMGMFHVFQNFCSGSTPYNCATDGDKICDTPPYASVSMNGNCSVDPPSMCAGFTYPALRDNHMDYKLDPCRNNFTPDQCHIMVDNLQTIHSQLIKAPDNMDYTKPDCTKINGDGPPLGKFKFTENDERLLKDDYFTVKLFPNPVHNTLNISFNTTLEEEVTIQITDLSGKVIDTHSLRTTTSEEVYPLKVEKLVSGAYILRVVRTNGEIENISFFK